MNISLMLQKVLNHASQYLCIIEYDVSALIWTKLAVFQQARVKIQIIDGNSVEFIPRTWHCNRTRNRPIESYWTLIRKKLKKQLKAINNSQNLKYRYHRTNSRTTENMVGSPTKKKFKLNTSDNI